MTSVPTDGDPEDPVRGSEDRSGQDQSTVLIVEDDALSALALRRMLERRLNVATLTAASAAQALRLFAENPIRVVLMDIFLEGPRDGIETAHEIAETSDVPIVFLTASSDESTKTRALAEAPYAFLKKPYEQEQICSTVEKALNSTVSREKTKLLEPDNMLELLYDTADIGMCVTDEHGVFVKVNNAYCRAYGYTEPELVGTHFTHVLPKDIQDYATNMHDDFVAGRSDESAGEWQVVTKEGDVRNVYVTAGRMITSSGARFKVTTVTDITDEKTRLNELERALKEKDGLLQEVYHRVKNNLNMVSSLLYLQAEQVHEDTAISRMFADSINRIQTLAYIHEHLYASGDPRSVGMEAYIGQLISAIRETMQWGKSNEALLEIETDIDDISLDMDRAISCGLIVNEMLSNCFRHGAENGDSRAGRPRASGHARVTLRRSDGNARLEIRDDGPGLPEGFDVNKSSSLGIQIIQTMGGKLGGTVSAWNEGGAVFSMDFPLPAR